MKSLLLASLLCITGFGFASDRPNVILFMADDMGMGDTSAYQDFTENPDEVQLFTPQMERLARMGMRFTDAHTPAQDVPRPDTGFSQADIPGGTGSNTGFSMVRRETP